SFAGRYEPEGVAILIATIVMSRATTSPVPVPTLHLRSTVPGAVNLWTTRCESVAVAAANGPSGRGRVAALVSDCVPAIRSHASSVSLAAKRAFAQIRYVPGSSTAREATDADEAEGEADFENWSTTGPAIDRVRAEAGPGRTPSLKSLLLSEPLMTCSLPTLFLGTSATAAVPVPASATRSAIVATTVAGVGRKRVILRISVLPRGVGFIPSSMLRKPREPPRVFP